MRTLLATLIFPDGKKLMAKAAARCKGETVAVEFVGDPSQLLPLPEKGTLEFFEWYFQGIANNRGAELTTTWEGDYEQVAAGGDEWVVLVAEDDTNDFDL